MTRHGFVQTPEGAWYEATRIIGVHVGEAGHYWTAELELEIAGAGPNEHRPLGSWDTQDDRDAAVEDFLRKVTFVLNKETPR